MLVKGDKVKLVKPIGIFDCIGTVFDVKDIGYDGTIVIEGSVNGFVGKGVMSYDEYEKYFKKVESPKAGEWTEWELYLDGCEDNIFYRTNGKKVEVKHNGYKASASCSPDDTFNINIGIELCLERISVKKYKVLYLYAKELYEQSKASCECFLNEI